MDYQTTLHEAVKKRLLEVEGPLEFGNGESRTRKHYYLKRLDDNLVVPMSESVRAMYEGGSGSELDWKMCSIRSSSAMTFNLLGNGPVGIASGKHAGTYDLTYEYQLPTLRNNLRPANLDAYLESRANDIYCEMKMFEWLGAPHHVLRPDYLETAHYLIPADDAERFIAMFRALARVRVLGKGGKSERLSEGRYDCLQMAKHLLAIYGKVANNPAYRPRAITLLNCVWEFTNPSVLGRYEAKYRQMESEEHEGFEKFAELVEEHVAPLFDAKGIVLSVEYVTACELMSVISYEKHHKAKLARYEI
ncbi:MAG: hypothetical protein IJH04_05770 [Eggerthellaceae bacterium]|nr:hypothetical protein [Eggerthellaceae bacterium]